jgi:hypothetical protein
VVTPLQGIFVYRDKKAHPFRGELFAENDPKAWRLSIRWSEPPRYEPHRPPHHHGHAADRGVAVDLEIVRAMKEAAN